MKKYTCIVLCALHLSCQQQPNSRPQISSTDVSDGTAKNAVISPSVKDSLSPIAVIKQQFTVINSKLLSKTLDSTVREYDCQQERGGKVSYFSDKGKLVVIRHTYNEHDHFSATDTYFLTEDKLFFAYLTSTTWEFVSGGASESLTKDKTIAQRIYLDGGKAILCLEQNYEQLSTATHTNPINPVNKQVACKSVQPLLKELRQLLAFRNSKSNCLDK